MLYFIHTKSYVVAHTKNIYLTFLFNPGCILGLDQSHVIFLSPGPVVSQVTFFSWCTKAGVPKNKVTEQGQWTWFHHFHWHLCGQSLTKYGSIKNQWITPPWFNLLQIRWLQLINGLKVCWSSGYSYPNINYRLFFGSEIK